MGRGIVELLASLQRLSVPVVKCGVPRLLALSTMVVGIAVSSVVTSLAIVAPVIRRVGAAVWFVKAAFFAVIVPGCA